MWFDSTVDDAMLMISTLEASAAFVADSVHNLSSTTTSNDQT